MDRLIARRRKADSPALTASAVIRFDPLGLCVGVHSSDQTLLWMLPFAAGEPFETSIRAPVARILTERLRETVERGTTFFQVHLERFDVRDAFHVDMAQTGADVVAVFRRIAPRPSLIIPLS